MGLHSDNCERFIDALFSGKEGSWLKAYLINFLPDLTPDEQPKYAHELRDWLTSQRAQPDNITFPKLYETVMLSLRALAAEHLTDDAPPEELTILVSRVFENTNQNLEELAKLLFKSGFDTSAFKPILKRSYADDQKTSGGFFARDALKYSRRLDPAVAGSTLGRLKNMGESKRGDLYPTATTNIPNLRRYTYQTAKLPREHRFGTQAETFNGKVRASPLFDYWIKHGAHERPHVYFNCLASDRSNPEGIIEQKYSERLHQLETATDRCLVITLPSDKLSLSSSAVLKVDDADRKPAQTFFNNYLKITDPIPQAAGSNYFPDNNQDFYISQATREKIWPKGETTVFKALLEKSFTHMGICLDDNITPAQAHAAWFHFLKFELPNDILTRTQASSFNMSCKDAIDRGGVASAYYNLMKSIELGHPLTRDEFERALQAPPAMVKARRMNKHIKNIWNAVFHTICQIETSKGELPDNLTWINDWLADTVSYTKNLRPIRKHYHFDHSEGSTSPEEGHSRQLGTITRGPDKLSNSDESTTGSSDDSSDGAQEHKGL